MSNLKNYYEKAKGLVAQMTLEEKSQFVSGRNMWETRGCERLGIEKLDMSDGPHGIRKQLDYEDIAVDASVKTVGFPSGSCVSNSWDTDVLNKMGKALGKNAKIHNVSLLLGPGTNIKRSPLCGRNFEYFSEDPCLAGELSLAYIDGVQSEGVSACVKHFAANNQETRRFTVNSVIDERALREIYLYAFEKCVKTAGVDTIMAAYNSLNGNSCSQNKRLLTDILRGEWGFDGMVVSDWGAVTNDVAAVAAGCNLKMPGFKNNPAGIAKAVTDGSLLQSELDESAARVVSLLLYAADTKSKTADWGRGEEDLDANHALARKLAAESMPLLKNSGVLPLKKTEKILLVGEYAEKPHFQGGGSSNVNVYKIDSAVELFKENGWDVTYISDFSNKDAILSAAKNVKKVIVFAGKPVSEESEGFDKPNMNLPQPQNAAIQALTEAKIPTITVVFEGSAVEMPWADDVSAILYAFLPGEAANGAVYDILTGEVNPSGKLAETLPKRLEDTPAYLFFPGEGDVSFYGESLFTGYRYYDKKRIKTAFPFGHGLSYTNFEYAKIKTDKPEYPDTDIVTVSVDVTNTGAIAGKEIVELYVAPDFTTSAKGVIRPVKELKAFKKVGLSPGETKTVTLSLNCRDFAFYDAVISDWRVNSGNYELQIGASSTDIRGSAVVAIKSTRVEKIVYTRDSLMSDVYANPKGRVIIESMLKTYKFEAKDKESDEQAYLKMILSMPLKALILVGVQAEQVDAIIKQISD